MTDEAPEAGPGVPRLRLALAVVVVGAGAGVAGAALTLVLHLVQHLAYGLALDTFLEDVERAAPARRFAAMTVGGGVVGLVWWAVRARGRQVVPIAESLAGRPMPVATTTADAVLQVVAVGAGASLGREGAPRQVGAALAGALAARLGIGPAQRRLLVACGAGAGLAAVYDVPLSGALFTLEVLLASAAPGNALAAVASAAVATVVAWPVVTTAPTYLVAPAPLPAPVVVWSLLVGPLAGLVGVAFARATAAARARAPRGRALPVGVTGAFAAVGAVAVVVPEVLGNGKGPAQLAFAGALSLPALALLLLLKPLATVVCLRGGAVGGLLTPSLATGALLGGLTGTLWSYAWPGGSSGAYAVVGAAAVLAVTQRAPLTAAALALELTRTGPELLLPVLVAVAGALAVARLLPPAPPARVTEPATGR